VKKGTFFKATDVIGVGVGDKDMFDLRKGSVARMQGMACHEAAVDQNMVVDEKVVVKVSFCKKTTNAEKFELHKCSWWLQVLKICVLNL
jgi:hypothetical protein